MNREFWLHTADDLLGQDELEFNNSISEMVHCLSSFRNVLCSPV